MKNLLRVFLVLSLCFAASGCKLKFWEKDQDSAESATENVAPQMGEVQPKEVGELQRVENYSQTIKEKSAELEVLLEKRKQLQEAKQETDGPTSFLNIFFQVARADEGELESANESDLENETDLESVESELEQAIAALLQELALLSESGTAALGEISDPQEAAQAAEDLQVANELASSVLESDESLNDFLEELQGNVEQVSEAQAEIDEAIENGDESVELELETTLGEGGLLPPQADGLALGKVSREERCQNFLARAEENLQEKAAQLQERGLSEDEIEDLLQSENENLQDAKAAFASGEFGKALSLAKRSKVKLPPKNLSKDQMESIAQEKLEEIKAAVENGEMSQKVAQKIEKQIAEGKVLGAFLQAKRSTRQTDAAQRREHLKAKAAKAKVEFAELKKDKQEMIGSFHDARIRLAEKRKKCAEGDKECADEMQALQKEIVQRKRALQVEHRENFQERKEGMIEKLQEDRKENREKVMQKVKGIKKQVQEGDLDREAARRKIDSVKDNFQQKQSKRQEALQNKIEQKKKNLQQEEKSPAPRGGKG